MTDKATPSPASVDRFMSLLRNHENQIAETFRVLQDIKTPSEEVRAAIDASSEARNALIAEVERLAAQAAPTEPPQEFESAQGRALASAWAEGWAQCRDAEYVGEEAESEAFNQSATLAQCLHADQTRFQGGLSNDELRRAWSAKLPNVIPTDEQLTAFALGIEAAAQPSQAPVVQAVPVNCGTGYCSCIECVVEPQAVRMLTKEEPEKCYSLDEETFHDLGDFIDMLDEEQAQPGFLVYEGESDRHTASHYARGAVSDLFERMGEQAFDDAGEHIGDWPDNTVKGDKLAELERLINDWLDANVKVHFYTVKNVRQIALTPEMLSDDDAGRTIPADGKIGGAA